MNFETALMMTARLLGVALLLQAFELWSLARRPVVQNVWHPAIDLRALAVTEVLLAASILLNPSIFALALLFVVHLLICSQFGGSLNGGSDSMTFVVLTGTLAAQGLPEPWAKYGLVYIAVQVLFSYLRAGISKLKESDWRTGRALPEFLRSSFYPNIRSTGDRLFSSARTSQTLSWAVIIFEISLVLTPLAPNSLGLIVALAACFHLSVFITFGLNRFFWIWMSAWPSVFYLSTTIVHIRF